MAVINGWVDWALRIEGHPQKVYSATNTGTGIALHSIVGSESETDDGVPNRFLQDTRPGGIGRFSDYEAASCMFVLRKSGLLIQMYDTSKSTWTSGGPEANTSFMAIELEGGPSGNEREPMTDAQVASFVRLVRDLEAHKGMKFIYGQNMLQHKEIAKKFGYAATSCASDRYDRGVAALAAPPSVIPPNSTLGLNDAVIALRNEVETLRQQLVEEIAARRSLNDAVMARESLRGLASGSIEGVRQSVTALHEKGIL